MVLRVQRAIVMTHIEIYQAGDHARIEYKVHGQTVECTGVFLELDDRDVLLDPDLQRQVFKEHAQFILEHHNLTGEEQDG